MSCYLCGCDDTVTRQEGVRDNPEINVLECVNCGLVFLSSREPLPTIHRLVRDIPSWAKRTVADDIRRAHSIRELTKGKLVLDFGCGNGGFLLNADAGIGIGLEIDDEAREYCKGLGLTVASCLESLGSFDVITMFHVIEHIPDPTALLKEMRTHLLHNGKIVIETPNSDDALLSMYGCKDFAEFTFWSKHPFLYNEATLTALAHQAGYTATVRQYQRYPLANHLYWLSQGKPNGHSEWPFLRDAEYADSLAKLKRCDTIIATLEKA
jgi:SAM-dependent methyltransferase